VLLFGKVAMNKKVVMLLCSMIIACHVSESYCMNEKDNNRHEDADDMRKMIGIYIAQNERSSQEDAFFYGKVDGGIFLSVLDGHGTHNQGHVVAQFLANKLPDYFDKVPHHFSEVNPLSMKKRMKLAFALADESDEVKLHPSAGSTASVVFIKNKVVHCGYIGDSRVVLECKGKVDFETVDHKANRADEYVRIENAGGQVIEGRALGVLAVSRAFGDYDIDAQKKIIIAKPTYNEIVLTEDHHYLIMASDGLWDKVSSKQAVALLEKATTQPDLDIVAEFLAFNALRQKSTDNITVMIIDLVKLMASLS
jgi:protein phosphatase 2C family protein 2/3